MKRFLHAYCICPIRLKTYASKQTNRRAQHCSRDCIICPNTTRGETIKSQRRGNEFCRCVSNFRSFFFAWGRIGAYLNNGRLDNCHLHLAEDRELHVTMHTNELIYDNLIYGNSNSISTWSSLLNLTKMRNSLLKVSCNLCNSLYIMNRK